MMMNCVVCQDKKKFTMKEHELSRIEQQLKVVVRRFTLKNRMEKPLTREEEMFFNRCNSYQTHIRMMCGKCPKVNTSSITMLDKKIFIQLLFVFRILKDKSIIVSEKELLKRNVQNILRGYYPELCRFFINLKGEM